MKTSKLTPEQLEDKSYYNWLIKCRRIEERIDKAELNLLKAEGKLIQMKLKALKSGCWLPKEPITPYTGAFLGSL